MAKTKLILGFIAGVSAGAIAGILLAPDSGGMTRKKIIDKSCDLTSAVKDSITGLLNKLQKGVEEEMQSSPLPRAGEEKIRQVMHNVKENLS
ncbi:MAG: YtxH domain-containing protein [Chitinophagaceae bacterium]